VKAYFEITIDSLHLAAGNVALGFADDKIVEDEILGCTNNSYGYFSDGFAIHNQKKKSFGIKYGVGDTIGCAIIVDSENKKRIFYTLNGNFVGFPDWEALESTETLYPTISINCQGKISTNLGQKPFVYNLIEKPDFDVNKTTTVISEKTVNTIVKENHTKIDLFDTIYFTPLDEIDITELACLHNEVFQIEHMYPDYFYDTFLLKNYCNILARQICDNKIIGFIIARSETKANENQSYVVSFGISKEYQRCGLGSLLLAQITEQLKENGCESMSLHTWARKPAVNFYIKNDFTITKIIDNYYGNGKQGDALYLERAI